MPDPRFDPDLIPRHIAIIMDGNGRWAKAHGLSRRKGHEAGGERVREIVRTCGEWGIQVLTLYAFSSENWSRPAMEVKALMFLLRDYLQQEREELNKNNVRLMAIGNLERLPKAARKELDISMEYTSKNTGLILNLALSYGGRDEIVRVVQNLAGDCVEGRMRPAEITPEAISNRLDTAGLPDPDLIIRTAGEMRISNFLLWQASYAEYYATSAFWPDFSSEELAKAIAEYQRRTRKFGGLESGEE
ncbi:MAG: isoprenyl transferase [Planctomycetes bacterium]|nr:isoprenyl transferase [Planctomycetota bacterium]